MFRNFALLSLAIVAVFASGLCLRLALAEAQFALLLSEARAASGMVSNRVSRPPAGQHRRISEAESREFIQRLEGLESRALQRDKVVALHADFYTEIAGIRVWPSEQRRFWRKALEQYRRSLAFEPNEQRLLVGVLEMQSLLGASGERIWPDIERAIRLAPWDFDLGARLASQCVQHWDSGSERARDLCLGLIVRLRRDARAQGWFDYYSRHLPNYSTVVRTSVGSQDSAD